MTTTALPRTDLDDVLQVLAAAAAHAPDDDCTRAVLAVVVQRLEDAAGAWLGETDGDPLVVLQRRFGRAHARLVEDGRRDTEVALLHALALALQPAPAVGRQEQVRTASAPALAGC